MYLLIRSLPRKPLINVVKMLIIPFPLNQIHHVDIKDIFFRLLYHHVLFRTRSDVSHAKIRAIDVSLLFCNVIPVFRILTQKHVFDPQYLRLHQNASLSTLVSLIYRCVSLIKYLCNFFISLNIYPVASQLHLQSHQSQETLERALENIYRHC